MGFSRRLYIKDQWRTGTGYGWDSNEDSDFKDTRTQKMGIQKQGQVGGQRDCEFRSKTRHDFEKTNMDTWLLFY